MSNRLNRHHALAALFSVSAVPLMWSGARAQESSEKIRVAGVPTEDATNMYYAVKTGMFSRSGLDVEMVNTASGSAATTATIAGTYEMARPSTLNFILAHSRGLDLALVSAANAHDSKRPLALLQIARDSSMRTAADLNGKVIGVPSLNDINSVAVRAWSEKNGGDWKSLKFVELPNTLFESAIGDHRIDAAIMQSPFLFNSLSAGTTKTLGDAWGAIAPRFIIGVNVARASWAAQHKALVARFVQVYYAAARYVNTHQAETAPYVVELTKADPATVASLHRAIVPTELRLPEIQPVIDAAARYGAIPSVFSAKELLPS